MSFTESQGLKALVSTMMETQSLEIFKMISFSHWNTLIFSIIITFWIIQLGLSFNKVTVGTYLEILIVAKIVKGREKFVSEINRNLKGKLDSVRVFAIVVGPEIRNKTQNNQFSLSSDEGSRMLDV